MNETIIKEIVCRAFEKAKKGCAIHSRYALSKHIGDATDLSTKTLERAYDRYVLEKKDAYAISEASLNLLLCKYLGYDNYEDYTGENRKREVTEAIKVGQGEKEKGHEGKGTYRWTIAIGIGISFVFGGVLLAVFFPVDLFHKESDNGIENRCMTWAKNHYEEIICETGPYSQYGTEVVSYEKIKIQNFKKIEVTMATNFFAPVTNRPLIWYTKNKDGEIEYFTSPGLHPITGKTLNAITPYIIQKYVPIHSNNKNSFVD